MTFEEVMHLTRTISSETAFDEDECFAYWELLNSLPIGATVIEIGLQFGRSSSIVAQVGKEKLFCYYAVDSFLEGNGAKEKWISLMNAVGKGPFWVLLEQDSKEVANHPWFPERCDLALIDGDHSAEGVRNDCRLLAPRCVSGGYICLHDYGRDSLPDVKMVADEELKDWKHIKTAGTLGVFQKP